MGNRPSLLFENWGGSRCTRGHAGTGNEGENRPANGLPIAQRESISPVRFLGGAFNVVFVAAAG